MTWSSWDQLLWRFNGILILAFGLLVLIFGAIGAYRLMVDGSGGIALSGDKKEKLFASGGGSRLKLGLVEKVDGTSFLMASLLRSDKEQSSSYEVNPSMPRNFLFFNVQSQKKYWAFESNHQKIFHKTPLYKDDHKKQIHGFMLETERLEPEGKIKGPSSSLRNLEFFSLIDFSRLEVLKSVDRVIGMEQASDSEVLLFYVREDQSYVRTFSMKTKKIGGETEITIPN